MLAANPKLKAVSSMNITQDRIDLAAATELGIPVTNIPAIVTDATADIGFGLLLAVARNIALGDKLFRSGRLSRLAVQSSGRRGGDRQDAGPGRLRPHRPGDGAPRPRLRHDDHLCRSAQAAAGRGGEVRCRLSQLRRSAARGRFRLAASAAFAGDAAPDERPAVRADEAHGVRHQHLARAGDRRGGAGARAEGKENRWRGPRRLRARAAGFAGAGRDAERGADPASRQRGAVACARAWRMWWSTTPSR